MLKWKGFWSRVRLPDFRRLAKIKFNPKDKPLYRRPVSYVVVVTLIASLILALYLSQNNLKAATYTWQQTDWSGGADTNSTASHSSDQSGWTKYYSKDATLDDTGGELKLRLQ